MLCLFAPLNHPNARAFREALAAHRQDTGIGESILPLHIGSPDDPHTPAVALCFDVVPPDDWCQPHRHVIPVIQTVDHGARLPEDLREFNAFIIDRHGPHWPINLFDEATSLIWLPHRPKRVFLSYVRRESAGVARQLHDALVRDGYRVFLDEWTVGVGASFQRAIYRDIADTDAVILLATRSFAEREYVVKEINSALTRRVGVLTVCWPQRRMLASGDDQTRNYRDALLQLTLDRQTFIPLKAKDFTRARDETHRRLMPAVIDEICHAVRRRRLVEIRRRIESLLPIADTTFGPHRTPGNRLGEFTYGETGEYLVALCPYRPTHLDLHRLHCRALELTPTPHEVTCLHAEGIRDDPEIVALTWLIEDDRPRAPKRYRIKSHTYALTTPLSGDTP